MIVGLIYIILVILSFTIPLAVGGLQGSKSILSVGTISYTHLGLTWLHTEGRYIKDESGRIVRLRGAAYGVTYLRVDPEVYRHNEEDFDLLKRYGANVVRLCTRLDFWSDADYISKFNEIISWCKSLEIYVILDLHHAPDYRINPETIITWWEERARDYINEPTVCGFGLHNEPPGTKEEWRNFVSTLIERIQAINPNPLLFVGNIDNCAHLTQFIANPLSYSNIVYAGHRYYHSDIGWEEYANSYAVGDFATGYAQMEEAYQKWFFLLLDMGYPVILEEFAAFRGQPPVYQGSPQTPDPNYLKQYDDLLTMLDEREVGFLAFAWSGATPGYTTNYAMLLDDWSDVNEMGEVWVQHLA